MRAQPASRMKRELHPKKKKRERERTTEGAGWGGGSDLDMRLRMARAGVSLLWAFWLCNPEQHLLWEELDHKTHLLQAISFLSCPRHPFRVLDAAWSLTSTDYTHGANRKCLQLNLVRKALGKKPSASPMSQVVPPPSPQLLPSSSAPDSQLLTLRIRGVGGCGGLPSSLQPHTHISRQSPR